MLEEEHGIRVADRGLSMPFASDGNAGTHTLMPGVWTNQASTDCEW